MLQDHVVDEVIFAVSKQDLESMEDIFIACEEEGVKTRVLVNFFPHLHAEVYVEKLQSVPMLTFSSAPENEYLLFLKRLFDTAFSAILLVLLSPLFLIVAILIKLSSRGPAIYSQIRCGLNGRRFRLYKFRSMHKDAEDHFADVQHLNELDGPAFKSSRDPRITPLGRYLRRLSVDEWPQLFNIVKGEMSFVGPRPPVPQEVERYERWQRRRLRMKPGLTCLWALEGRNQLDFRRWMRLDLDYIEHWSLLLDFKILFRTIPRVLSGRGAS
jgi:exopolysaccharide biosynthesis polyprenyl glycosylphosphotransferase